MKKLVIIQTVTPDYRASFFNYIEIVLKNNFELYGGDSYFEESIKSDTTINRKNSKNIFFLNRKVLFQTGVWHLLFKDIVLVLEMNPRILSNWIFLIVRKLTNKETILWGHAWPRKGNASKSDKIRNFMRLLGNKIIVYTNKQKEELRLKMPKKEILAAPNAVINANEMITSELDKEYNIIYVGRLTKQKKPFFLVKAFEKGMHLFPETTKLIIVGEGEEKNKIKEYIFEKELQNKVEIKGHISNYETLKVLYSNSFFSVSPGYIGLSVTQSFGFGVPMLVSENENHSPEIEAVKLNENALYFKTDDENDFILKLKSAFENKKYWIHKRKDIVNFCKKNYSTEAMANVFVNLVK